MIIETHINLIAALLFIMFAALLAGLFLARRRFSADCRRIETLLAVVKEKQHKNAEMIDKWESVTEKNARLEELLEIRSALTAEIGSFLLCKDQPGSLAYACCIKAMYTVLDRRLKDLKLEIDKSGLLKDREETKE